MVFYAARAVPLSVTLLLAFLVAAFTIILIVFGSEE